MGLTRSINPRINPRADAVPPTPIEHCRQLSIRLWGERGNEVFRQLTDLQKSVIFFGIVFGLVVGLTFVPLDGMTMLLTAMFMPTVAVLLMLLVITRDGFSRAGWASLGLHRAGISAWPLAIVAPLAVLGISSGVVWSTGIATFAPPAGLDAAGWVTSLAPGLLQNLVVVTLTFSLGEEIGWRGYLLPKLAATLGNTRGMVLTGFLHGLFHMPIIFLTPYYHPDGNRWIIVPLFLTALTLGGLLYGYLRLSTNSVWPASLAHSAHNYFWALFGSLTVAISPLAAEYLAGESGILPIVGYGIVVAWLLSRKPVRDSSRAVLASVSAPRAAAPTAP
jgi:membrane protease YdiL (CAAX protease family)